ncbi:MAG TPA: acyloxyacyl hydrolase [Ramlibacter sp.]|uniref:acyloxyacyl hydrolase n=1 Tax=Ramlibacter sp. TaxID=1917967 RepID=UPI002D7ED512|nr:acyloxyacyl hydrolase [Ramlibacter sp.]HET8744824.1 acyloxyacyl hydrolase [Ramlibacter sp.]
MKTTTTMLLAGAMAVAAAAPAAAADFKPDGISAQVGFGKHGTRMAGVGLVWDWDFEALRRKAELTAHTELMVNRWRHEAVGGGNDALTQLVVLPSLRMRLDRGASPWFISLGIGASWFDRDFETPRKRFSTRWNFYDTVGVGYSFGGAASPQEVGLRWVHVSNGGVRHPNPGQDFLQLRYVHRF